MIHGLDTPPRTFWEGVSQTRWGRYLTEDERLGLLNAADLAGPPANALEVGCDGGRWSSLLHDRGWKVTCTDVAADSLAVCRERVPSADCVLVDAQDERLPAGDGTVKLLLTIEVAPVAEAEWFPREAGRVLESRGVLFAGFANASSPRAAAHRLLQHVGVKAHREYQGPSFRLFKGRLEANGIEIVSSHGLGWGPFTRASNNPLIPAATFIERALGLRRLSSFSPLVLITARKR